MTILADLLCGVGKPRLRGPMPRPRPLRSPCVTPKCICQATGIPPFHGFCKYLSLPIPPARGGMAAAGKVGEGVNAPPSPLATPVCDPKMHLPSHWDPAFPWFLQIPSLLVPSTQGGMAAAGNVGEGVNAPPSPLAATVCDPKMHSPSHWDHPYPWILQMPFPACSLDAGRHGGGKPRVRGQCPSPLSGCFPLKYSGGATGSPDCH